MTVSPLEGYCVDAIVAQGLCKSYPDSHGSANDHWSKALVARTLLLAMLWLAFGAYLFRRSLQKASRDGSLSRWN